MKKYRNVIIVGSKTDYVAISYENMSSTVLYRRFNKFSNMGKNNTDTVNSLSVINKYLSEIYNSKETSPHYFAVPNKICTAIKNGSYKNWLKTGKTASGKELDKEELYQWTIFSSLYKELFNEINFKPLSYYGMKNAKYNKEQMAYTKKLINKAYEYLNENKNNNLMDSLDSILGDCI